MDVFQFQNMYHQRSGAFAWVPGGPKATAGISPRGVGSAKEVGPYIAWHTCRETFHRQKMTGSKDFLFAAGTEQAGKNVKDFVGEFEKLVSDEVVPTQFRPTSSAACLYVIPGKWWCENIRLSLLTALLRCGLDYTGNNFRTALFSKTYTRTTQAAVERFLEGYTKYIGSSAMWVAAFRAKTAQKAERLLVKPDMELRVPSEWAKEEADAIVSVAGVSGPLLRRMIAESLDKNRAA